MGSPNSFNSTLMAAWQRITLDSRDDILSSAGIHGVYPTIYINVVQTGGSNAE